MKTLHLTTSWDDGTKADLKMASFLERQGLLGTFFIPIRSILYGWLGPDDVRRLSSPHEVGSHSISHIDLTKVKDDIVWHELYDSRRILGDMTRKDVRSFAYPWGLYSDKVSAQVDKAGYSSARTARTMISTGVNLRHPTTEERFQIEPSVHVFGNRLSKLTLKLLLHSLSTSIENTLIRSKEQRPYLHIWGHSWAIERNNEWGKLEQLLKFLRSNFDVVPLTFSDSLNVPNQEG